MTVVLTVILRALKVDPGVDQTSPADYHADEGDVGVEEELDPFDHHLPPLSVLAIVPESRVAPGWSREPEIRGLSTG